jgi:hypothetical protein
MLTVALRGYNQSDAYVTAVLQWIHYYAAASGPTAIPQPTGNIVDVHGIRVDASLAVSLDVYSSQPQRKASFSPAAATAHATSRSRRHETLL